MNTNNKFQYKYDSTYSKQAVNKVVNFDVSSSGLDGYALLALRRRNFKFIIAYFSRGNCSLFADRHHFTRSSLASLLSGKILFTQSYASKITKAVSLPVNTIDILQEDVLLQVLLDSTKPENKELTPRLVSTFNHNYPIDHPINQKIAIQRLFELKKAIKYTDIIENFPVTGYTANTSLIPDFIDIKDSLVASKTMAAKTPAPALNNPSAFGSILNNRNVNVAHATKFNSNSSEEIIRSDDTYGGYFLELVDVEASAGPGTFTQDFQGSEKIFISDYEYYRYLSGENPENLKAIKVRGDSMEPILKNNQICVVRMGSNFTNQGIYVFTYGNTTYIKRLNQANGTLIAISENQSYAPFIINDVERLEIHGKLVLALEYTVI